MKNPEITHAKRVPALPFTSYQSFRQSQVRFLKSTQIPLKFEAFWATKYGLDVFLSTLLHFPSFSVFVCIVLVILPVSFGYISRHSMENPLRSVSQRPICKTIEQTHPVHQ